MERALLEGMESPSGNRWKAHCYRCSDCRAELLIIESLEEQSFEESRHLGKKEVEGLLEAVRKEGAKRRERQSTRGLVWGLRAVAAGVAFFCVLQFVVPGLIGNDKARFSFFPKLGKEAFSQFKAVAAVAEAAKITEPKTEADSAFAGNLQELEDIETKLGKLRRRISSRRSSLDNLIEKDFGK